MLQFWGELLSPETRPHSEKKLEIQFGNDIYISFPSGSKLFRILNHDPNLTNEVRSLYIRVIFPVFRWQKRPRRGRSTKTEGENKKIISIDFILVRIFVNKRAREL